MWFPQDFELTGHSDCSFSDSHVTPKHWFRISAYPQGCFFPSWQGLCGSYSPRRVDLKEIWPVKLGTNHPCAVCNPNVEAVTLKHIQLLGAMIVQLGPFYPERANVSFVGLWKGLCTKFWTVLVVYVGTNFCPNFFSQLAIFLLNFHFWIPIHVRLPPESMLQLKKAEKGGHILFLTKSFNFVVGYFPDSPKMFSISCSKDWKSCFLKESAGKKNRFEFSVDHCTLNGVCHVAPDYGQNLLHFGNKKYRKQHGQCVQK